jgi:hypothetical protein
MRPAILIMFICLVVPAAALAGDGYAMQDNYVVSLKDGQAVVIDKEVSLADGTKISPEGIVVRNGKHIKLINGMMIDMNSNIIVRDGILMKDGKMLVVKDGDFSPMNEDVVMSNGIRVMPDGSILTKMKEGEMMMMNGTMVTGKGAAKTKQGKL